VLANIVLSGDNAVVIAMAARTLAPKQRSQYFLGYYSCHSADSCGD
jgi:predicted tellurium resistance membrane protein TerC